MTKLANVPNCVRAAADLSYGGRRMAAIFHMQQKTLTGDFFAPADLLTIANGLANAYKTNLLSKMHQGMLLNGLTVVDLTSDLGNVGVSTVSGAGSDLGTALPNQVAACVSWHIPRHYRGGHPRTYMPGVTQTMLANTSSFTNTFTTALQAGATAFLTACNAITAGTVGPMQLVCVHFYKGSKEPLAVAIVDPITSASVNPRIDTQRRRLGK